MEPFAVVVQGSGVHWVQDQVRVLAEQCHQRAALLFQGDGDGPALEALLQLGSPLLDSLRSVVQFVVLDSLTVGGS